MQASLAQAQQQHAERAAEAQLLGRFREESGSLKEQCQQLTRQATLLWCCRHGFQCPASHAPGCLRKHCRHPSIAPLLSVCQLPWSRCACIHSIDMLHSRAPKVTAECHHPGITLLIKQHSPALLPRCNGRCLPHPLYSA